MLAPGVVMFLKIGCGFVGIRCDNHVAATTSRLSLLKNLSGLGIGLLMKIATDDF
jgi:hypothetical protein